MTKDIRTWTDEELVRCFVDDTGDNAIYEPGVLEEICRRADMMQEWEEADGETFERVARLAAQELCPDLCRA